MKLTGRILDVTDSQPLGGASLYILNPDGSNSRTGTISLSDGSFVLDSPILDKVGAKVAVSFVGYEETKLSPAYASGNVYLSRSGDTLGAVVVTAKMNSKRPVIAAAIVSSLVITIMIILFSKMFKSSIIKN